MAVQELASTHRSLLEEIRTSILTCGAENLYQVFISYKERYDTFLPAYCSPVHCSPVHCLPVHCSPVHCLPVHCSPVHCSHVHCSPIHCLPVHCSPVHCLPTYCSPAHCSPAYCSPVHCSPTYCSPAYCSPAYCSPVHCSPTYCSPVHCSPAYCSPVHCSPAYCSPVHCSPAYCSPVHCSPAYCSPVHCSPAYCSPVHCLPVHSASGWAQMPGFLPASSLISALLPGYCFTAGTAVRSRRLRNTWTRWPALRRTFAWSWRWESPACQSKTAHSVSLLKPRLQCQSHPEIIFSRSCPANTFLSLSDIICPCRVLCLSLLQECSKRANSGRFSLRDLLMVPMQRVLKYHLLLQVQHLTSVWVRVYESECVSQSVWVRVHESECMSQSVWVRVCVRVFEPECVNQSFWVRVFESECLSQSVWVRVFESECLSQSVWVRVFESECLSQSVWVRVFESECLSQSVWVRVYDSECLSQSVWVCVYVHAFISSICAYVWTGSVFLSLWSQELVKHTTNPAEKENLRTALDAMRVSPLLLTTTPSHPIVHILSPYSTHPLTL